MRHIGHEVRTPLSILAVGTDVLCSELSEVPNLPISILEVVENMKEASSTALEVINELMTFEKLAAGMTTIEPTPVHLIYYLRGCMKTHQISARAKNITMNFLDQTGVDEESLLVSIDPVKMNIVFRNLLSNAVKFTPEGGIVSLSISIISIKLETAVPITTNRSLRSYKRSNKVDDASKYSGDTIEVKVTDSGAGLSPDQLSQLFQEGKQFNANKLQGGGGSGLGLFISKGLVNLHENAKIWAESEGEGKGCTFFVQLPLLNANLQPSRALPNSPYLSRMPSIERGCNMNEEIQETTPFIRRLSSVRDLEEQIEVGPRKMSLNRILVQNTIIHILVVDDSAANRKMVARMLKLDKYAVTEACDGLDAVSLVTRTFLDRDCNEEDKPAKFDVVLMDSIMPRMSGPEACREMRKYGYINPIIGITGLNDNTDFMEAGVDMVMQKPVNRKELNSAIIEALKAEKRVFVPTSRRLASVNSSLLTGTETRPASPNRQQCLNTADVLEVTHRLLELARYN